MDAVSALFGKALDQIEYESSCYFYREETDEVLPGHIMYIDTRDGVNSNSMRIIVNVHTGGVLSESPILNSALDRVIYDDNDTGVRPANPSREEGDPEVTEEWVNNAYDSSEKVYDLFDVRFGRDSWDGDGGDIVVQTRWVSIPSAQWNPVNDNILIGGGNYRVDKAFDVMAHEFAHGVWKSEGNGAYLSGEPEAMEESFCDCMAAIYDSDNGGSVWYIAEDIENYPLVPVRYLADPDSWGDADYISELNGSEYHDLGVPSLAFYLASEGGSHPDSNHSTIDVQASGIERAADVLYEAMANYYDSSELMSEGAFDQTLAALNDFGYADGCNFASAWYAVGVDDAFWHGGISEYAVSYMGWVFFYSNGTQFVLPNDIWHSYTDYDSSDGAMSVYSFDTTSWYWTSAEVFPLYYDYTTSNWDTFSGTFE